MRCDSVYRNYWFCHSSIDDHYISTTDVERHREEYSKGYPSLRVLEPSESMQMKTMETKLADAYKTVGELTQELERVKNQSVTTDELLSWFKDSMPTEIYTKIQAKAQQKKSEQNFSDTMKKDAARARSLPIAFSVL